MKRPATSRASLVSGTVFGAFVGTIVGFFVADRSTFGFSFGTTFQSTPATPTAKTTPASQGSALCQKGRLGRGSRSSVIQVLETLAREQRLARPGQKTGVS